MKAKSETMIFIEKEEVDKPSQEDRDIIILVIISIWILQMIFSRISLNTIETSLRMTSNNIFLRF